jgi:hypothetical protein
MIMKLGDKNGYLTLAQLGVLLSGVVVATITIQHYVRTGIQASYRDAAHFGRDFVINNSDIGADELRLKYQPYYVDRENTMVQNSRVTKTNNQTRAATLHTKEFDEFQETTMESRTLPPLDFELTE